MMEPRRGGPRGLLGACKQHQDPHVQTFKRSAGVMGSAWPLSGRAQPRRSLPSALYGKERCAGASSVSLNVFLQRLWREIRLPRLTQRGRSPRQTSAPPSMWGSWAETEVWALKLHSDGIRDVKKRISLKQILLNRWSRLFSVYLRSSVLSVESHIIHLKGDWSKMAVQTKVRGHVFVHMCSWWGGSEDVRLIQTRNITSPGVLSL